MKKIISILIGLVWILTLAGCGFTAGERAPVSQNLTVLMYHHFKEDENGYIFVSKERFREQLAALKDDGYETVSIQQLLAFVEEKKPLPPKPLLITIDDGYASNLELAAPVLEELSMTATIFAIGITEGADYYVHTGKLMDNPHFSYEEAQPWIQRGVINVQSHTYDLHQLASDGFSGRDGMLRMGGEGAEDYAAAILEDCRRFKQARADRVPTELTALAYPYGFYTPELDRMLESEFQLTFTIKEHTNTLIQGDPSTLRMLGRVNVTGADTGEMLIEKLNAAPAKQG